MTQDWVMEPKKVKDVIKELSIPNLRLKNLLD